MSADVNTDSFVIAAKVVLHLRACKQTKHNSLSTHMKRDKTQLLTPSQALLKSAHYCAYQERCQKEVRAKLAEWGLWGVDAENIVLQLIEQNYLNEERFARAFAGGKFRTKQWGRNKIKIELRQREISDYCLSKAMLEIDGDDYLKVLEAEAIKKLKGTKDKDTRVKKLKASRYLIGKGFEPDLTWDVLNKLM